MRRATQLSCSAICLLCIAVSTAALACWPVSLLGELCMNISYYDGAWKADVNKACQFDVTAGVLSCHYYAADSPTRDWTDEEIIQMWRWRERVTAHPAIDLDTYIYPYNRAERSRRLADFFRNLFSFRMSYFPHTKRPSPLQGYEHEVTVGLPLWSITAVCMGLRWVTGAPARKVRTRRKREALGLCAMCGFDVRHSVDRCPECGAKL